MYGRSRQTLGAGLVGLGLLLLSPSTTGSQSNGGPSKEDWRHPAGKEWPTPGGDWGNTRHSALTQITTSNVKNLGGAWLRELDSESRATPIIKDGLMLMPSATRLYALNPKSGDIVWSYLSDGGQPGRKGVAVGEGLVFVGLLDASVVALKLKTGEQVWREPIGELPVRAGQSSTTPPSYAGGIVVAGLANGDFGVRGRVVAFDAKTGRHLWRFYTIPSKGERGSETWPENDLWTKADGMLSGGGVWTQPAVDPDLGLVYVGVGNAVPQMGGELRPGDNLFNATVVALDLKTGKLRWYYQLVHHDIWDADLGTQMVLYDAVVDGRPRKALAAMRTDGYLFLLDRETGKPVLPIEERAVPQDRRLATAPTQPFPVGADRIGPDCVDPTMIPPGFEPGCWWEPLYFDKPNVATPGMAMRGAPMSYSPQTGYFYAAGGHGAWEFRRRDNPYAWTPLRIPGGKEYGILAALDSKTNKIVWQKRSPYQLNGGSGAMTTAGGLLFHLAPDGVFQAYDAKTGMAFWSFQTGFMAARTAVSLGGGAPSVSYEIDGEQYVAVTMGRGLWAFKLGGHLPPRPAAPPPPTEFPFGGIAAEIRAEDASEIAIGVHVNAGTMKQYWNEYGLMPTRARVKVGTPVRWMNHGVVSHTITTRDGAWSTGPIRPGQVGSVTFDKPGTYTYICKDHPWSIAQLIVE